MVIFSSTGLLFIIFIRFSDANDLNNKKQSTEEHIVRVEIRPTLINCHLEYNQSPVSDSEISRFQREELLKHNQLQDCKKKVVLSIKILSEPNDAVVDEYIPIEHVIGVNNKRLRLLNPYVVRIRRQPTYENYNINMINTVRALLIDPLETETIENDKDKQDLFLEATRTGKSKVNYREGSPSIERKLEEIRFDGNLNKFNKRSNVDINKELPSTSGADGMYIPTLNDDRNSFEELENMNANILKAQSIRNVLSKNMFTSEDNFKNVEKVFEVYEIDNNPNIMFSSRIQFFEKINKPDGKTAWSDMTKGDTASNYTACLFLRKTAKLFDGRNKQDDGTDAHGNVAQRIPPTEYFVVLCSENHKHHSLVTFAEKEFLVWMLYRSISTVSPEWSNEEMNIRYKGGDWMPRESYTLPPQKLCLLVPVNDENKNAGKKDFIILPQENIIVVDSNNVKSEDDIGDNHTEDFLSSDNFKTYPRVDIRVAKAITRKDLSDLEILTKDSHSYIQLPFRRLHQAQIDLEANADDNDVILVGSSGSLITVVSDTKHTRAILDVQAKNTGLAAAGFRVVIRECSPEILSSTNNDGEGLESGASVVPPFHTRRFRLEMPFTDQIDKARCVVALLNNDDESVAVRQIRLKRSDRCFCVWHCDCVCLGEDPKLLCHSMSQPQILAAGLPPVGEPRLTRSVCYPDVVSVNFFVTMLGVLFVLLLLGLIKACLGLFCQCIGSLGLRFILRTPRNLDHYFESFLEGRTVAYDEEGWPVHPTTKERTVRVVSKPMEYVLNVFFFVILPCMMFTSAIKNIISRCQNKVVTTDTKMSNIKKCFSSVQSEHRRYYRRREGLRRWMSPQAEELTNKIWTNDLNNYQTNMSPRMRPLIKSGEPYRTDDVQTSCVDSEQDDTEYILMKMQKSKVSLHKNQSKLLKNESEHDFTQENLNEH